MRRATFQVFCDRCGFARTMSDAGAETDWPRPLLGGWTLVITEKAAAAPTFHDYCPTCSEHLRLALPTWTVA